MPLNEMAFFRFLNYCKIFKMSVTIFKLNQIRPKKIYVCFSSEKKKLGMVGRSALPFNFTEIFYIDIAYPLHSFPFFSIFDYIFLKFHNKMFRVGTKNQVGSGNL